MKKLEHTMGQLVRRREMALEVAHTMELERKIVLLKSRLDQGMQEL